MMSQLTRSCEMHLLEKDVIRHSERGRGKRKVSEEGGWGENPEGSRENHQSNQG